MSQPPQIPGTPKELLRAIRIFLIAIIAGATMFLLIAVALNKMEGDLAPRTKEYSEVFLYIAAGIAALCLIMAVTVYKRGIAVAKDSLIPLMDKLNLYRTTLIRYVALCEGAALFSIIAFFLTGNYYLLVIIAIMIVAMLLKAPTKQRVTDELALDWQQQQELE